VTFPAKAVTWRGWGYGAGLILVSRGWFGSEPPPPAPTPPPPPLAARPPSQVLSRISGGGGGGGGHRPPDWLLPYLAPEVTVEEESDYALIHVTEGAVVRAVAAGVVASFVDGKGRSSVVLTTDDGTRYWYADISVSAVADGTRVAIGQPIARAKANAPAIPTITPSPSRAALLPHEGGIQPPPSPPAQIIFVESPPPPPPRRWVKLVPIRASLLSAPPSSKDEWATVRAPERHRNPAIAYVAGIGAFAALLYALSRLPVRPKRRKRRPKR